METWLNKRERQIQAAASYHITPEGTALVKHSTIDKCWRGCGDKGNPSPLMLGMEIGHSHYGGHSEGSFRHENENEIRKIPNTIYKINSK